MNSRVKISMREKLGCWLHERKDAEFILRLPKLAKSLGLCWQDIKNRHEKLTASDGNDGRVCNWRDTSQLTLTRVFPSTAKRIFDRCTSEYPFSFLPQDRLEICTAPKASFIIAIGGIDRLPQFRLVLKSLRCQTGIPCEIIIVEQGRKPLLKDELPTNVRYLFLEQPTGQPFNKSWALNAGARIAIGDILLIHDADFAAPVNYAAKCFDLLRTCESARPSRFNFHLTKETTEHFIQTNSLETTFEVEMVVQNNPTPIAITRNAYWSIGGHDESFVGWGGEDVEFLSRMRTTNCQEGGFLPILHLWHPAAPNKVSGNRNSEQQEKLLAVPPQIRIDNLCLLPTGNALRPTAISHIDKEALQ